MNKIIVIVASLLISSIAFSQDSWCGMNQKENEFFNLHPEAKEEVLVNRQELENFTQSRKFKRGTEEKNYIIPIVFHILHQNGPENISDEDVIGQVAQINEDFNAYNSDSSDVWDTFKSRIGNANIQFVLPQKDPDGNPTNGIIRWETDDTNDPSSQQATNGRIWDRSMYLNIFVLKCMDAASCSNPGAGGVAAYTYKPGQWSNIDAIYARYYYVGPGQRTLSHEIGHWFNLSHTWGDSNDPGTGENCSWDDQVDDTPNTDGQYGGCGKDTTCGSFDNVQNIMNYSSCEVMFTQGQVERMRSALESSTGERNNLWTDENLLATGITSSFGADFINPRVVCAGDKVNFHDKTLLSGKNSWSWTFDGGNIQSSTEKDPTLRYVSGGMHDASIQVSNGSETLSKTKTNAVFVLNATGKAMPFMDSFEDETSVPSSNWLVTSDDSRKWELTEEAAYSGTKALKLNNFGNSVGASDVIYSNSVDLSTLSSAKMDMRVAFAQVGDSKDEIQVWGFKNCGQDSLTMVSYVSGANLAGDNAPQDSEFTPSSTNQWKKLTFTVLTSEYLVDDFMFKIKFVSDGGNNIFIDDINFTGVYKTFPILQYPANGRNAIPDNVVLDWKAVNGVDEYEYELDVNNQFNSVGLQTGVKAYISQDPTNGDTEFETSGLEWGKTYYWRVRAIAGGSPSEWSEVWSFTVSGNGVGIYEKNDFIKLAIAPNPVGNNATLSLYSTLNTNVKVSIVNILGQQQGVIETNNLVVGSNSISIDTSNLSKGVYFVVVDNGSSVETRKFIKN